MRVGAFFAAGVVLIAVFALVGSGLAALSSQPWSTSSPHSEATATQAPFVALSPISVTGHLPSPRYAAAAAWVGNQVIVVGGAIDKTHFVDEIVSYAPINNVVHTMTTHLPERLAYTSLAWDDSSGTLYILGGQRENGSFSSAILRYDPMRDAFMQSASTLPEGRCCGTAFWDRQRVIYVGGYATGPNGNEYAGVDSFNPSTGEVSTISHDLPGVLLAGRGLASAGNAWDGHYLYLMGGQSPSYSNYIGEVTRLDPYGDVVERVAQNGSWEVPDQLYSGKQVLESDSCCGSAWWDSTNQRVILAGGIDVDWQGSTTSRNTYAFDPATKAIQKLPWSLPEPRSHAGTASFNAGNCALIFGGYDGSTAMDSILQFEATGESCRQIVRR